MTFRPSILLVDDEPGVRTVGRRVLEREGYRVTLAETGHEGLERCREHSFAIDLLITDVVMPGLSGSELVAHARRERPGIRVLYISGYTDDRTALRDIAQGEPFLPKPFAPADLTRKVRELLAIEVSGR